MESSRLLNCSSLASTDLICSFKRSIWLESLFLSISACFAMLLFSSMVRLRPPSFSSFASYSVPDFSNSALAAFNSESATLNASLNFSSSALNSSASVRNRLTSFFLSSSLSLRYSLAFSAWCSSGPTCFSSSASISLTRTRLLLSSSSFFCAAALRLLNFTIPAASSKSSLLSSGFPLKILSIWPCPIIE